VWVKENKIESAIVYSYGDEYAKVEIILDEDKRKMVVVSENLNDISHEWRQGNICYTSFNDDIKSNDHYNNVTDLPEKVKEYIMNITDKRGKEKLND